MVKMSKEPSKNSSLNIVAKVLGGEVTIYTLTTTNKQSLYYRFKDPITGKYVRRSSKTTDIALASKVAIDHYNVIQAKHHLGMTAGKTTIRSLYERFDGELSPSNVLGRAGFYKNYLRPFFGDRDISDIDESDVVAFIRWRDDRANWSSQSKAVMGDRDLTISTHLAEQSYLGRYLKRGFDKRLVLHRVVMPSRTALERLLGRKDRQSNKRRGRLTEGQREALDNWRRQYRRAWSEKTGRYYDEFINVGSAKRFGMARFYALIHLMGSTGIRPMEAFRLTFGDVETWTCPKGISYTIVNVRKEVSKVNKFRDCVAKDFLRLNSTIHQFWASEYRLRFGVDPTPDSLLFPSSIKRDEAPGNRTRAFRRALERVSGFIGVDLTKCESSGMFITAYSFRSLYATEMLAKTSISIHTLARMLGNSPKVLLETYDINENLNFRESLTEHYRKFEAETG
tara:strand:+ start:1082 stop:2440 length:1359 start_codon:yes stop_codon:yes gene_type:complete